MLVVLKEDYKLGGRSLTTPIHLFFLEEGESETYTISQPPTGGILPPKGGDIRGGRVSTETKGGKETRYEHNRVERRKKKTKLKLLKRSQRERRKFSRSVQILDQIGKFVRMCDVTSEGTKIPPR